MDVYLLWSSSADSDNYEIMKLLGVYSSIEKAEQAKLSCISAIEISEDLLAIERYRLDEDTNFSSGFFSAWD